MKHRKKFFAMLLAVVLCAVFAACGSPAGNTGGGQTQAESAAEESKDKEIPETESEVKEPGHPSEQANDTDGTANVAVIAWSTGMGDENEFIEALKTSLSEEYADRSGEVFVMDANQETELLPYLLENIIAMWEDEKFVLLIVNDEKGFSDEDLLSVLKNAEKAGIVTGVDHAIDGAPESAFVYDASDAAGCAAMIMENAGK